MCYLPGGEGSPLWVVGVVWEQPTVTGAFPVCDLTLGPRDTPL